jgi:2-oxoacid:acceptor oxidoreductase delta subunit (pyruvate/2-ketoisovalerate family)
MAIDCYLRGKNSDEAIRQMLIGDGPSLSIFRYLNPGEKPTNSHVVGFEELNMDYFEPSKRQEEEKRLLRDRKKGFGEVTSTFTKEVALMEGERCFSCGTCNDCENCYVFCPDASILKREGRIFHQVDYDFCKGCGVCFVECPRRAISLEEEAR